MYRPSETGRLFTALINYLWTVITRLVQFTQLIPVQGRLREFNFRQRDTEVYDVNVADERGDRHYFKFAKKEDGWQIFGQLLPTWLQGVEPYCEKAISDQRSS